MNYSKSKDLHGNCVVAIKSELKIEQLAELESDLMDDFETKQSNKLSLHSNCLSSWKENWDEFEEVELNNILNKKHLRSGNYY